MIRNNVLFFLFVLILILPWKSVKASPVQIPPGFYQVRATIGVQMYQKDYAGGSPDYVQVIDLSQGASLRLLHGSLVNKGEGNGVYGGDNPTFVRQSIEAYWNELTNRTEHAFCVSNGQFFRMADSPSPLPFPLKVDGEILTDGYGINEFPKKKLILEIWPDRVDIQPLTRENLYESSAPNIVAGLTEDAEKAAKRVTGRTFIGIADSNGDGSAEIVFLFNTRSAKPSAAADSLRLFGADKVMMLDGGGSTQLVCQDVVIINTDRQIPQALAVIGSSEISLSADFVELPEYEVGIQGEPIHLAIQIENKGLQSWEESEVQLVIQRENGALFKTYPIDQTVLPGQLVRLSWFTPSEDDEGIQDYKFSLVNNGKTVEGCIAQLKFVFLPQQYRNRISEFERLIEIWTAEGVDIDQAVRDLLTRGQAQARSSSANEMDASIITVKTKDLLWVPRIVIPAAIIFVITLRRSQRYDEFDDMSEEFQV